MSCEKYRTKLCLANMDELRKFVEKLTDKYGYGNVPLEEVCKFDFRWVFVPTK